MSFWGLLCPFLLIHVCVVRMTLAIADVLFVQSRTRKGWVPSGIVNAASKLAEVVSQQAQSIEEEQSKIRDADPLAKIEAMKKQNVPLPWEGLSVEDPVKLSALTLQILSLAKVCFFPLLSLSFGGVVWQRRKGQRN